MILMRGHNICFRWEIRKIISELSLLLLLIWSSDVGAVMQLAEKVCVNVLMLQFKCLYNMYKNCSQDFDWNECKYKQ